MRCSYRSSPTHRSQEYPSCQGQCWSRRPAAGRDLDRGCSPGHGHRAPAEHDDVRPAGLGSAVLADRPHPAGRQRPALAGGRPGRRAAAAVHLALVLGGRRDCRPVVGALPCLAGRSRLAGALGCPVDCERRFRNLGAALGTAAVSARARQPVPGGGLGRRPGRFASGPSTARVPPARRDLHWARRDVPGGRRQALLSRRHVPAAAVRGRAADHGVDAAGPRAAAERTRHCGGSTQPHRDPGSRFLSCQPGTGVTLPSSR